jgi:hypothetical protein
MEKLNLGYGNVSDLIENEILKNNFNFEYEPGEIIECIFQKDFSTIIEDTTFKDRISSKKSYISEGNDFFRRFYNRVKGDSKN